MKIWVVILSLVVAVLCIGTADRAIDNIRESRVAETSREMVVTGDWVIPHFNGAVRLQKPPFTYWTTALSYKLFGVSELSTRLPSMLFAIMLLALMYTWLKQQVSAEAAASTVLVLATSLISLRHFRSGEADTTLIFFITAACYAGFNLLHKPQNEQRKWATISMLAMGLGFLSKGPAGIAIPLLTLAIYAYLNKKLTLLKSLVNPLGLALFILTAGGWYIWILLTMPDASQYFLGKQLDETFVSGTHQQPIYWYLLHITEFFLPWGLLIIPMAIWHYKRKPLQPLAQYAATWFGVVFLLLTFTVNKQMQYALLFAPSLAVLIGLYVTQATGKFLKFNKVLFCLLLVAILVMVVLAVKKHSVHAEAALLAPMLLLLPIVLKQLLRVEQPSAPILIAASLAAFGYLFSDQYLSKDVEKNDIKQLTMQILDYQPVFQAEPGNGAFSFYAKTPIKTMRIENIAAYMQAHDVMWYLSKDQPELKQNRVAAEKTIGHWTLWKITK